MRLSAIKKSYSIERKVEIPKNYSEILLSSAKNLDVGKLVEKDFKKKLLNDETNEFHFYDIPIFPQKDESKKKNTKISNFKSIHNNLDLIQLKTFTSRLVSVPNYTCLEKKARNSLKKKGSLLMLNEMFFELEKNVHDKKHFSLIEPDIIANSNLHDPEYKSESTMICNIDKSLKKAQNLHNVRHQKGYLPDIRQRKKTENDKEKNESLEDIIYNKYNKEESENLKMKVKKKEDYEIQLFLKKMPKINKISTALFENEEKKQDETNEDFIINLKKNVKTLLKADISKSTILESAEFYEKHVDQLNNRIEYKTKNLEALLVTKERTMQLIRKENIHIIERICKIKETKNTLRNSIEKPSLKKERSQLFHDREKINNKKAEESNKGLQISKQVMEFNLLREKEELKRHFQELAESLSSFEKQLNYNNKMIEDIEQEKKKIKEDLSHIYSIQKKFLMKLLKSGKDYRNHGLIWLIKKCQSLGEMIHEPNLPDYLDKKAKEFLLQKAKMEEKIKEYELFMKISVEILKENIIDDNDQIKILDGNSKANQESQISGINSSESFFYTRLPNINKNDNKLEESKDKTFISGFQDQAGNEPKNFDSKIKNLVYKSIKNYVSANSKYSLSDIIYETTRKKIKDLIRPNYESNSNEKTHFEELDKLTFDINYSDSFTQKVPLYENDSRCLFHENRNDFLKNADNLNRKITETKKTISKMENAEINRIIKEFDYKNYAKRFSIDVTTVISSLVGVRQAVKEVAKYGMIKNS